MHIDINNCVQLEYLHLNGKPTFNNLKVVLAKDCVKLNSFILASLIICGKSVLINKKTNVKFY